MVMTTFSTSTAFTVCVLGRSTSMPDSRMGAVTIKMISSTSMTSTNGVTLISESDVRVRPWGVVKAINRSGVTGKSKFENQIAKKPQPNRVVLREARDPSDQLREIALGHVHELQNKIVHQGAEFLDALKKIVVGDPPRNGRKRPAAVVIRASEIPGAT